MNNIIEKRRRTRDRVRRHRFVHQNTIVPQNHPLNDDSDSDINSETECVSDQENSNRSEEDVSEGGISEQLLEHSQSEIDEENGDSGDGSQIDHEESVSSASVIDENSDIGSSINEATDDSLNERNEAEEIRKWAIKEHLSHSQLDGLLVILRRRLLPELPKTAKTFLRTSAVAYDIQDMEDYDGNMGQFVYFGIAERLRACVNEEVHIGNEILIQVNVDGLPLFKSSNTQLWPILCKVVHEPDIYEPVPVAIYAGSTKPKRVDEFLDEFIEEMNQLSANGIDINGRLFQVKIQSFICDTPARSFLKCVKGHTGYYACERCTVRGCRPGRSTVFPDADCPERSAEDFNRQRQREHHNSVSPLLRLRPAVNLVLLFILDFLHLACHGVMKKLLKDFWLLGNLHLRLGRRSRIELSRRMEYLKILNFMLRRSSPQVQQVCKEHIMGDDKEAEEAIKAFQLVEFDPPNRKQKRGTIECVPSTWISYNPSTGRCQCKFMPPPYSVEDSELLCWLVKEQSPLQESWPVYPITLKGHATTYDDAMKRLKVLADKKFVYTEDGTLPEKKSEAAKKAYQRIKVKGDKAIAEKLMQVQPINTSRNDDYASNHQGQEKKYKT
ncbi:uncharacterized protein LOC124293415 [Neodiprion lecontei]|uniref:Uncharacterized protein LOC124293415 n=1 Tax=Neodiprion lecontei TaxID=441921 RepID=A0ABM3FQE0_NEOLC|nr:uncharacterized protein LOC124293415 [Neodiprion lecontei]